MTAITPIDKCPHPDYALEVAHERMPLRYGSAAVQVCAMCGSFRTLNYGSGPWQPGPLAQAISQACQELEDEA